MRIHVTLLLVATELVLAGPVLAAGGTRGLRPKSAEKAPAQQPAPSSPASAEKAAPAPAEKAAPAPAPAPANGKPELATEALLDAADAACKSLDYDVCVDLATQALSRPDITETQQARAYTIQGAAYAIVGQSVEAERPYRLLLRIRPDFDMPKDTPPKILAVFRKVQAEENEIRQAVKEAARRKIIQSIKIQIDAPDTHKGGTPLQFFATVTDPLKGINSLTLEYRMDPEAPYAAMPFQSSPLGQVAEFSGAQMSTDQPLKMQYLVVARDAEGEVLTTVHTLEKPGMVDVEAGQVAGPPIYESTGFRAFAVGGVVTTGLLFVGGIGAAVALVSGGASAVFLSQRGSGVVKTQYGQQNL